MRVLATSKILNNFYLKEFEGFGTNVLLDRNETGIGKESY